MTNSILLIPVLVSFFATLFTIPYWIKKAKEIGLTWPDINKSPGKKVSGSGGIMAMLGFAIGVLLYIAYKVFYLHSKNDSLVEILSLLTVVLMLTGLGFIDDLLGWRKGGLSIRSRLVLVLLAAIPLVVINAGKSQMVFPFFGLVEFGILYPLVLIPLGIVGATTTYNFLAGFNGLEAGQGVIILSALAVVSYFTGSAWLSIIALCMISALLAFLVYNFDPALVFPGDSLTYAVGGLIAIIAILGNFEKIAVFFFIPYILETGLKLRGGLKKHSFGKPKKDGSLDLKYDKVYSLNHLAIYLMKRFGARPTEKKVVFWIWAFQAIMVALGLWLFREGIFAL